MNIANHEIERKRLSSRGTQAQMILGSITEPKPKTKNRGVRNELKVEVDEKLEDTEKFTFADLRNDRKRIEPKKQDEIDKIGFAIEQLIKINNVETGID